MNKTIWTKVQESLSRNNDIVLITIVKTDGSAPGKTGFKMIVSSSGGLFGTVGGGNTEFMMVEKAKQMLRDRETTSFIRHFEHTESAEEDSSGMVCGGSNTIAVIWLDTNQKGIVDRISEKIRDDKPFRLCISPEGLELKNHEGENYDFTFIESADGKWRYEENINIKETLYIVGGGHVGLALSRISEMLGFHTVVLDDRKDVDSIQKNRFADEQMIVDYGEVDKHIEEGDRSYVVIMTSGHKGDKQVLERLVNKKLKYLGMMGSKEKKKRVYQELLASGIEEIQLDLVHSPVGLPINSITPQEIAVSIMAEIIKVKNS